MTDEDIDKILFEIHNSKEYFILEQKNKQEEIEYRKTLSYLLNEIKVLRQPFKASTLIELSAFGNEVISKGGWIKYNKIQSEKEEIERRKSKIDLELAEKMLKEYPKTKWIARISFLIAFILGLKEIISWIKN